jgi:hypothetical protein
MECSAENEPKEKTDDHLNASASKFRIKDFFQIMGLYVVLQNWNISNRFSTTLGVILSRPKK